MASLIPGYEYDIFISYRQKDNKGDRWVSEFVEALKTELESTFKDEVTVYFDVNPHDGLLDTYDVDATLKQKLKSLVFIPVVSRTYCDPNSFAWENEFKPFVENAQSDQFGLKIKLPSGNVTSRVLPVRIHDLDLADIKLCESVLGSALRGVDFVYRSSGVNRPLRINEDHPNNNFNKTDYRDQINKLANAICEIILSLKNNNPDESKKDSEPSGRNLRPGSKTTPFGKILHGRKAIRTLLMVMLFIVCISGAYYVFRSYVLGKGEKTIAIIPLTNPPNDKELAKYAIGSMDAIITKLQEIKSLTVRGRLSSLQYLDTKKSVGTLRKELKANYIVEISISKAAKNLVMWIGLTKTKTNKELWASQYEMDEEQLMPLFTKVVQTIAGNLDIKFSGEEIMNIEKDMTKNPEAYLNYLSASARLYSAMGNKFLDSASFKSAILLYDKAIKADPDFASAYARRAIALSWGIHTGELNPSNIEKCWKDITTAAGISKDLVDVQIALGFYYYYCKKDYLNALISFNTATIKDPENYQPLFYMALVYRVMGDWEKVHSLIDRVIKFNPQEPLYLTNIGVCFDYLHNFDSALIFHQKAIDLDPDWTASYLNKISSLLLKYGNTAEAHKLLDSLGKVSHENHNEYNIIFDLYDGKYSEGYAAALKANKDDFSYKGARYAYLADFCKLMNEKEKAGRYYDSALVDLTLDLAGDNNNANTHAAAGLIYAAIGNKDIAITEGKKAIELTRTDKNKMTESDMIINLAQIYTMLGLFDDALYYIEYSLKNPSFFSTKMLEMDPVWKPLAGLSEFKAILAKYNIR
jgi:tetratricopeptide (TPR) repeat protein